MEKELYARECKSGALSCQARIVTNKKMKIIFVGGKGMPRVKGDGWFNYMMRFNKGDVLTKKDIDYVLSFNGKYDVHASYEKIK